MDLSKGRAQEGCMFQGQNYRITLLSERLLRLEYNKNGIFYDAPSQFAINRKFPVVKANVKQDEKYLEIVTKYFTLSYAKEKSFDAGKLMPMANLKISVNNSDKSWYINNAEAKTLPGLNISEDGTSFNQRCGKSLYSLDGYTSFNDSNTMLFREDGTLVKREQEYLDVYVFVYGNDFTLALNDYYILTGFPPLVPRYALGTWWSRDLPYTSEDILELERNFSKEELPLSTILLEKQWHQKIEEIESSETGYTFNKELIENPKELIEELHKKGVRIGLSINPKDGISPKEENYALLAKAFGLEGEKHVTFEPTNQTVLKAINSYMLTPLINQGIDFLSNDFQGFEGDIQKLWLINNSMYSLLSSSNRRGLLLSRNAQIATHRFPITYTGRTIVSWESLRRIPLINQNAANIGVSYISSDIAGNYGGIEEEELYIRSVELACFSPVLRFSAPSGKYYRKEPWRWNAKTLEIVSQYLALRQKLIPYIYSACYQYHQGTSLITPLYHKEPFVMDDINFKNEYFFGPGLLVCPILSRGDSLINRTIHKFYLPEGVWYNLRSGKKFQGKKEYISFYKEEDYPIFAKSGSIIPMSDDDHLTERNPKNLEINVYPGDSGNYTLYEDDGLTTAYQEGAYVKTNFEYQYAKDNYVLTITSKESRQGIVPDTRNIKVRFHHTKGVESMKVYVDNIIVKPNNYMDDLDFIIELEEVPYNAHILISCKGKKMEADVMRLINDEIDSILLDLPINTVLKEKISAIMFSNLAIKRKRIEIRHLNKLGLGKEHIRLFLKLLEYIEQI